MTTLLGLCVLVATGYVLLPTWLLLLRRPGRLPAAGCSGLSAEPPVTVIVPARNEAANLDQTLKDLRAQHYTNLEILVVDDRSTDNTAAVAARHAEHDPRVQLLQVRHLPDGWLGKNHACWLAAGQARGRWLLFTDADVCFHPDAVRDAIARAEAERLDHLTLVPGSPLVGFLEAATLGFFGLLFLASTWGSLARSRRFQWAYAGVGAFNLVRRSAYEAVGGHEPLRLEVVDDVMLGWLLKQGGFRQELLFGGHRVQVHWQKGVLGIVLGLEKNAFAGMGYSAARTLGGAAGLVALFVIAPVYALVCTDPAALAACLATAATLARLTWLLGRRVVPAVCYPVAALVLVVALVRSAWRTLSSGVVRWRDTPYPLDRLRAARRRLLACGQRARRSARRGAG